MSITRKPRSDFELNRLPKKEKDRLEFWLEGGMGYAEAAALVAKEFKVSTSKSSVQRFWESYVAPRFLVRRQRSAQAADQLIEEMAEKPGMWDEPLKDSLKEMTFRLLKQGTDPEAVMFLMGCVGKVKDQELKEAELKLKRDKFELDAAKLALKHLDALRSIRSDRSLTQNARLQKARAQLFGELPAE